MRDPLNPDPKPKHTCSACGGAVEEGCILAPSIGPVWGEVTHENLARWCAKRASRGFFGWTLPPSHPLTATRCTNCGKVEFYAG